MQQRDFQKFLVHEFDKQLDFARQQPRRRVNRTDADRRRREPRQNLNQLAAFDIFAHQEGGNAGDAHAAQSGGAYRHAAVGAEVACHLDRQRSVRPLERPFVGKKVGIGDAVVPAQVGRFLRRAVCRKVGRRSNANARAAANMAGDQLGITQLQVFACRDFQDRARTAGRLSVKHPGKQHRHLNGRDRATGVPAC